MNKLYLLTIVLICSCSYNYMPDIWDFKYNFNPECKNIDVIIYHAIDYIKYTREEEDYIQIPCETIKLKTGDCDDHAIFILGLAYKYLGIKGNLIIAKRKGGAHAMVRLNGQIYDTTGYYKGLRDGYWIHDEIEFDDIRDYLFYKLYLLI